MSIKERRTRVEQAEDNRRRVLDAAREVFVAQGYAATTLDRIAERAGFTKGALFSRFSSKAELFLELYAERVEARVREIGALPRSRAKRTPEALTRQWLERLRGDEAWSLVVLEFRIQAAREPAHLARYQELHRRLVVAMASVVARDVESSEGLSLKVTPEEAAHAGMALANGLLLERLVAAEVATPELTMRASRALIEGLFTTSKVSS
ncbi:MAG: TetR/AcrR family transcriptional regulator [Polyangiaceae bacterium]